MSKQLKQPKAKFQFRIRSLLIGVFLASAAVNIYLWIRPVEIPVPVVMGHDGASTPVGRIFEQRAWWIADSMRRSVAKANAEYESEYEFPQETFSSKDDSRQVARTKFFSYVKDGYVKKQDHHFSLDEVKNFLQWLHSNFGLEETLSVVDVIERDAIWDGHWSLDADYRYCSLHCLQIASIQAAGVGKVVSPDFYGNSGYLFDEICEIAGDKFRIEAHDVDEQQFVRLLINNRVYRFHIEDTGSWYDDSPACDVLNTILVRQNFKERFFVFQRGYGNSYVRLVMYGLPEQIKNLVETFEEFEVVKGAEIYWQK